MSYTAYREAIEAMVGREIADQYNVEKAQDDGLDPGHLATLILSGHCDYFAGNKN